MTIRAPKFPINNYLILIGTICLIGMKIYLTPINLFASENNKKDFDIICNSIISVGELQAGEDVILSAKDIIVLTQRIAKVQEKAIALKEVK